MMIVDANRTGDFTAPLSGHAPEILKRIKARRLKIVVGGKLLDELSATKFRDVLVLLKSLGLLVTLDKSAIDKREGQLMRDAPLRSDDPHVIAVAIMGSVNLIYTEDAALIEDLHDRSIMGLKRKILTRTTPNARALTLLDEC